MQLKLGWHGDIKQTYICHAQDLLWNPPPTTVTF